MPGSKRDDVYRGDRVARARASVFDARTWYLNRIPETSGDGSEGIPSDETLRLLEEGALRVWMQPKFDPLAGEISGFEVLCRMETPLGMMRPGEFVPFIMAKDRHVLDWAILRETLSVSGKLRDHEGAEGIRVGVNVHPSTISTPGFSARLFDLAMELGGDLGVVRIEILESELILDRGGVGAAIGECLALGVDFSLDDFCAGESSPADLAEFEVAEVKVDKGLVDLLCGAGRAEAQRMIGGIVVWAGSKGAKVTAEGVETREQAALLLALGVSSQQGFLWNRPMPSHEALSLLEKRRRRAKV